MEIDLFFELASPARDGGRPAAFARILDDQIALARAADARGFGAVWIAEHHFLGDYSNASAPELVLAAIARETARIGLGFAVLPLPIHEPLRVAERLATLDALSGGRVLWGVGRGVTETELSGFGIDPASARALMTEHLAALRAMLATGVHRRDGRDYELRPRPSPALAQGWMAAVSPESFDLAAELGLDVLTGPFKPWPMVERDLRRYRALRPGGRTSYTIACHCDEDGERARREAGPGLVWAFRKILELTRPLLKGQLNGYEDYRRFGWIAPMLDAVLSLPVLERLGLAVVGDPAHVARRLGRLRDSGLDRVSLVLGGGDLPLPRQIAALDLIRHHVVAATTTKPARERAPA